MNKLEEKVVSLFKDAAISMVIGYEEGDNMPRPFFCHKAEDAGRLIYNTQCYNNLATYLTRTEIVGNDKVAVIATLPTLRAIAQLASENQLHEDKLIILTVTDDDEVKEFSGFSDIVIYLAEFELKLSEKYKELDEKLEKMSREERWNFWVNEFSRCIKCYACRAACPLCYCTRCITDVNCPQWINPWPSPLANMEWQINRIMHMIGRCIGCGSCGKACPVGIPIDYLTRKMVEDLSDEFGYVPGRSMEEGNALSTFKPDDKENFIH
jgi:ferredoxin